MNRDIYKEIYSQWQSKLDKKGLAMTEQADQLLKQGQYREYCEFLGEVVDLLEARDFYTANHSRRVAEICLRICVVGEYSEELANLVVAAAMVHDIGKIGIPDAVLLKAGPLTNDEFEKIKEHSVFGYTILNRHKDLREIALTVRHHHEAWDGSGYPDKSVGENIPLPARIIAIGDSIDAMLTDRPYRDALSHKDCKEELKKCSGIKYDPEIVDVCLENWDFIIECLFECKVIRN